jgi:3-methyladenine DNA glycosylase AlkD
MKAKDLITELESLGNEQTRKTYKRHGVIGKAFGVSYADLGKLQKKFKTNHELASGLWASDIHDARIFATMIADPSQMKVGEIDAWAKDLSNYVITDALAGLVSKTSSARKKAEQWTKSKDEWLCSAGWQVIGDLARRDPDLPDSYFLPYLATIERDIHSSKNRVRHAMNSALIGLGTRNAALEKRALSVAKAIGKVEVDHGETGCKTPDAAGYIRKTNEHVRAKAAGR